MKSKISTSNAPAAIGPYSQAITTGNLVFVSGQLGLNPATGDFAGDSIEEQARQSLTNDVVKTTCMLADIDDFQAFNAVYAEFFSGDAAPARSAFAVKSLPKGGLVEVEAIALKK